MFRVFGLLIGCAGATLLASGCGPIEYITTVTMQAQKAVKQAKQAQAAELAPYEYTLAVETMMKARELAGYARFQEAVHYGKESVKYGREAEGLALTHGAGPSRSIGDPSLDNEAAPLPSKRDGAPRGAQ
jgi:hypothetical protein